MNQRLIPSAGKQVDLDDFDPRYTAGLTKRECGVEIQTLRAQLDELQDLLYADGRYAVLVLFQGIDTSGKDGTIRSVFRDVGPLGTTVHSFVVPSEEELGHDFLWRYHAHTPPRGRIGIFNRSHYEAVLVERVKKIVPGKIWKRRYEQINGFESILAAEDTVILKFFLHISRDEQRERLQARIDNPGKRWKFRPSDLEDRKLWDDYQAAYNDAISNCNTSRAPWHIVPADKKWYRDVVVARTIVDRISRLDLRHPPDPEGLDGLTVV